MLYLGIIFLVFTFITLFFSKDPLKIFYWNKDLHLKDEKGFIRFQGVNYFIVGIFDILLVSFSSYISRNFFIPIIIILLIIGILYSKYRRRYFEENNF